MTTKKKTKQIGTSPYNYTPSKGIKIEGESMTIQDDSMSLREMIERHVQGVLDDSIVRDGQYHGENVDFDTDVSHTQLTDELEALTYAEENGMTAEEIETEINAIKDMQKPIEFENETENSEKPQEDVESDS